MKNNSSNKQELLRLFERFSPRIDLLSEEQRMLARMFLSNHSYNSIARIAGVNKATVARKLKKIADGISDNNFFAALSKNNNLSAEKMEILKDHFVSGLSVKTIAQNKNVSIYLVRKIIRQMRNL